jgi:hypothetical protein
VNWSALLVADVPLGVVTVTSTVPAGWAGAVAMISVSDSTKKSAGTVPKLTAVAAVKPLPRICTVVVPAVVPLLTFSPVTAGLAAAV